MTTTTTKTLVEDNNGEPLLWLETYADGVSAIIDTMRWATPFDPTEERIGDAVERWMRAVGMKRWPFTVTWYDDALRPGDWETWCKDDFRIDSNGPEGAVADLYVWGISREDAYDYLVNRIEPGMLIKDEDE